MKLTFGSLGEDKVYNLELRTKIGSVEITNMLLWKLYSVEFLLNKRFNLNNPRSTYHDILDRPLLKSNIGNALSPIEECAFSFLTYSNKEDEERVKANFKVVAESKLKEDGIDIIGYREKDGSPIFGIKTFGPEVVIALHKKVSEIIKKVKGLQKKLNKDNSSKEVQNLVVAVIIELMKLRLIFVNIGQFS